MGRIRTIKPEFFTHSGLFDAETETALPLRLAFAGLWTCCDREGRFKWRPRELKLAILPYDECDFSRVLDALDTRGFIVRYAIGTEVYGRVPSWSEHQFINNKEHPSTIPEPLKNHIPNATPTREQHVKDTNRTCGVKEGKGKEGEGEQEGNSETPPLDLDSGSELMLSCWLLEELGVPADNATRRIAADAIRLLAKEGGTTKTAADYILAAAIQARNSGETINRFWFTDQKYRPQPPPKSKRQREKDARREAFLAGTEGDHE